jgi:hypothetical protein
VEFIEHSSSHDQQRRPGDWSSGRKLHNLRFFERHHQPRRKSDGGGSRVPMYDLEQQRGAQSG